MGWGSGDGGRRTGWSTVSDVKQLDPETVRNKRTQPFSCSSESEIRETPGHWTERAVNHSLFFKSNWFKANVTMCFWMLFVTLPDFSVPVFYTVRDVMTSELNVESVKSGS